MTLRGTMLAFGVLIVGSGAPLSPAQGEVQILEVALSRSVEDRLPHAPYSPPAYCEKDQDQHDQIPIINLATDRTVVFWTKLSSSEATTIRHQWLNKKDDGWTTVSNIDFDISKSSGFRVWSSKDLLPSFHRGEWMVVVVPADDTKNVLCLSRFLVQ